MKTKILITLTLAFVLTSTNLKASIVYTNYNKTLDANGSNNSTSISIMGKTIRFSHWGFTASGFQIDGNADARGVVSSSGSEELKKLTAGNSISSSNSFVALISGFATAYHGSPHTSSSNLLSNGQSSYFGFKITNGANTYYGWIKLTRTSSDVVVINEYAYDNTAGAAINAGATTGGGGSTSLTENKSELDVKINFTPSLNQISIVNPSDEGYNLEIFNISGQIILQSKSVTDRIKKINMSNLPKGISLVKITVGNRMKIVKVKN